MNPMTISDLKFQNCEFCEGPAPCYGAKSQHSIFYMTETIEVRCNNPVCGHVRVWDKEKQEWRS